MGNGASENCVKPTSLMHDVCVFAPSGRAERRRAKVFAPELTLFSHRGREKSEISSSQSFRPDTFRLDAFRPDVSSFRPATFQKSYLLGNTLFTRQRSGRKNEKMIIIKKTREKNGLTTNDDKRHLDGLDFGFGNDSAGTGPPAVPVVVSVAAGVAPGLL